MNLLALLPMLGKAAAIPFVPSQLPTIAYWSRSDSLVTTGAGRLTVWGDKLGSGNTMVPQTAGSGPIYNSTDAAYNGFPSFTHASGNGLTTSAVVPYGPYTIIIAGRVDSSLPGYLYFHTDFVTQFDACSAANLTNGSSDVRTAGSLFLNMPSLWANAATPKVYTMRFNGTRASKIVRKNGVNVPLSDSILAEPGLGVVAGFVRLWGSGNRPMAGSTAEIIVCSSALSDADMVQAEQYMISRYAIS